MTEIDELPFTTKAPEDDVIDCMCEIAGVGSGDGRGHYVIWLDHPAQLPKFKAILKVRFPDVRFT